MPESLRTPTLDHGWLLDSSDSFGLLTCPGFAPGFRHGFLLRGTAGVPLDPVRLAGDGTLARALQLPDASITLPRQVHGTTVAMVMRSPAQRPNAERPEDEPPPAEPPPAQGPEVERPPAERPEVERPPGEPPDAEPPPAERPPTEGPDAERPPAERSPTERPEADAVVASSPGLIAGVMTADCLPILLAEAGGGCAAVHAGWRGLLAGVIGAAHEAMHRVRTAHGAIAPLEAAIGPAIGACCFEVGPEVAEQFIARWPAEGGFARASESPGRSMVDLVAAATHELVRLGIAPERIRAARLCTRCGGPELESYRKNGPGAGRMAALIGLA